MNVELAVNLSSDNRASARVDVEALLKYGASGFCDLEEIAKDAIKASGSRASEIYIELELSMNYLYLAGKYKSNGAVFLSKHIPLVMITPGINRLLNTLDWQSVNPKDIFEILATNADT